MYHVVLFNEVGNCQYTYVYTQESGVWLASTHLLKTYNWKLDFQNFKNPGDFQNNS